MRKDANEMTQTTNYEEKMILGQARGMSVLYIRISFFFELIFQFFIPKLSFLFFWGSPHKDLHFSFIFTHRLSQSYTWRAKIAFPGLLSHPERTSKFLQCNSSCATTVHGHFLINAVREVVAMHLMGMRQLLHPSPFISLITHAKSTFFLL